jgi:hypothetical protein
MSLHGSAAAGGAEMKVAAAQTTADAIAARRVDILSKVTLDIFTYPG